MDLSLTPTTEADLDAVVALESDPDVAPWISPWPRERHLRAISAEELAHLSFRDADGAFAGLLLLAGLSDPERSIELRRIALRVRGRGLGAQALQAALAHCFEALGAQRVWLDLLPDNERAAAVYRRVGLTDEGVVENAHPLPDGSLGPLRFMSISSDDWRATRTAPRVA